MTCHRHADSSCPFANTEESELAQSYGCLPTQRDIVAMRVDHGKTWACHADTSKPCGGAIAHLQRLGLPHKVIDTELLTEQSPWERYL